MPTLKVPDGEISYEVHGSGSGYPLMIFATALDPIFRISVIGRPEAHDLIATSCCGSNTRLNELDGLPDPELVGEVGHRENLSGLRRQGYPGTMIAGLNAFC